MMGLYPSVAIAKGICYSSAYRYSTTLITQNKNDYQSVIDAITESLGYINKTPKSYLPTRAPLRHEIVTLLTTLRQRMQDGESINVATEIEHIFNTRSVLDAIKAEVNDAQGKLPTSKLEILKDGCLKEISIAIDAHFHVRENTTWLERLLLKLKSHP